MDDTTRFLTVEAMAKLFDIGLPRAYELLRQGIIPSVRLGRSYRIDRHQLEAWIANGGAALAGGWRKEHNV